MLPQEAAGSDGDCLAKELLAAKAHPDFGDDPDGEVNYGSARGNGRQDSRSGDMLFAIFDAANLENLSTYHDAV